MEYAIDLETFFGIAHMDTVYIASPNSLHFEQAKQAILAKKNVIVEKPAFSTPDEMAEIIELANKNRVYISLKRPVIFMSKVSKKLLNYCH